MTTTHLRREGGFEECESTEDCALPFHFPNTTAAEMEAMPERVFLELMTTIQPPTWTSVERLYWMDAAALNHRDYDLPALVHMHQGHIHQLEWYQHGLLHREGDRPAKVAWDNTRTWFCEGKVHREHGPAVVHPDGRTEYWRDGELISRHSPTSV